MDEQVLKRVMPNSLEAEQAVIGSMMLDREALQTAAEKLTPDDFYHRQFGVLFEALVGLMNEGKPTDLVVVQDRLKEMNAPAEISNLDYVRELIMNTETSANVAHYANIVYEKSMLRRLIRTAEGITNNAYAANEGLDTILENTEKEIFDLLKQNNHSEYVPIDKIVMKQLNKIAAAGKQKGGVTGVPTGFIDLDAKTSGLQPSDFILVAARPSMGKTALVLNIAQHVVTKEKLPVVIFSLEMSKEQLVNRLLAMESHVDSQALRTGRLTEEDWGRLGESADIVGGSPLIIDDTPAISVGELRSKCRKYKLEKDIKLVIIDYLQLITSKGKVESHQLEVSEISRSLKALARELDVPVIALSQLSRAPEQRTDHRPMLSDLRDSGSIEQDADVVMFIYREDYYNHNQEEHHNKAEINIAKQRNGPTGDVPLIWLPQYTQFVNCDREYNE